MVKRVHWGCGVSRQVPWITKKVTEYFGEPEQSVIDFVVEEVRKGPTTLRMQLQIACFSLFLAQYSRY